MFILLINPSIHLKHTGGTMLKRLFKNSGKNKKCSGKTKQAKKQKTSVLLGNLSQADIGKFRGINIIVGTDMEPVFIPKIYASILVDNKKRGNSNTLTESTLAAKALAGALEGVRFITPGNRLGTAKAFWNELARKNNIQEGQTYQVAGCCQRN